MIWKVSTKKTNKVLYQSSIQSTLDSLERNISLDSLKNIHFKLVELSKNLKHSNATDDSHEVACFHDYG